MTATAHAPKTQDRAERPPAAVRRSPEPEPDAPQTLGLLHDEPGALAGAVVQRRAVVGAPDDPLEHEADRAADRVVRGEPAPHVPRRGAGLVRRCACGSAGCGCDEREIVQRQPLDEEEGELVQARAEPGRPAGRSPAAHRAAERAVRSPGPGAPLRPDARRPLERGFGTDLGDVRVHDDAAAHRSAAALGARAFAHGRHIWLGQGASQGDLHLMAHETAHVLQQDGVVRRRLADVPDDREAGAEEPETEAVAEAVEAAAEAVTAAADADAAPPDEGSPSGDGGASEVELLMPEPPASLSDPERARLGAVDARAGQAASAQTDLPSAEAQTGEARGAVAEPQAEANARAEQALVEALGERPEPSAEVEELCARIRSVIESRTPPDEEALVRTDPEEVAADAGRQLDGQLEGEVENVEGEYGGLERPQQGTPEQTGGVLHPPPESVETPDPQATRAVPDGVAPEAVSLDADVEAAQARRDDSGMTSPVADEITDPSNPVVQARQAQGELEETAAQGPGQVIAEQRELLATAEADMAGLQARALAALQHDRAQTVRDAAGQQGDMVGTEEQTRESVAREAQQMYSSAQTRVREQLGPLQETAMRRWESGVGVLAAEFRRSLDRVAAWIEERHGGTWGGVVSVWDDLAGLPDWITREYDQAEARFGDGVCALLREISTSVHTVILACERVIADARTDIDALFDALPHDLREWAETERGAFHERLNGLAAEVQDTRQSVAADLTARAAQSVDEVRQEVHALRETAKGLVGQLADAVDAFMDDPARFIIEGLLTVVGIEPAAFWAVVARIRSVTQDIADDPLGFAGNLLLAVGQGFERFFDNVKEHLLGGLLDWLFSSLGSVGVEIPQDTSLTSVVTFFLQLMGITWDRIRTILAKHIGEENVALLERAYEIVSSLIEMGPQGVFEMIKEQLDPQRLLSMVLEAAVDFLVEALITQVTTRVLLLFNPVGAVAQAIEAIYRVLKWLFENAAKLFTMVETVVNGVADILAGNVGGMAQAIEGSLSRLVAPVIDFFAGYVGLGDLPDKIADVIKRMQTWVEGILDRVIGFIARQARQLLAALGVGGEDGTDDQDAGDGEIGKTIRFSGGGERHRLWLRIEGAGVTAVVASDEEEVKAKLVLWRGDVETLPDADQGSATTLLDTADAQLHRTEEKGDEAATAAAKATSDPTDKEKVSKAADADTEAEREQDVLAQALVELFDLLGETSPGESVEEAVVTALQRRQPGPKAALVRSLAILQRTLRSSVKQTEVAMSTIVAMLILTGGVTAIQKPPAGGMQLANELKRRSERKRRPEDPLPPREPLPPRREPPPFTLGSSTLPTEVRRRPRPSSQPTLEDSRREREAVRARLDQAHRDIHEAEVDAPLARMPERRRELEAARRELQGQHMERMVAVDDSRENVMRGLEIAKVPQEDFTQANAALDAEVTQLHRSLDEVNAKYDGYQLELDREESRLLRRSEELHLRRLDILDRFDDETDLVDQQLVRYWERRAAEGPNDP